MLQGRNRSGDSFIVTNQIKRIAILSQLREEYQQSTQRKDIRRVSSQTSQHSKILKYKTVNKYKYFCLVFLLHLISPPCPLLSSSILPTRQTPCLFLIICFLPLTLSLLTVLELFLIYFFFLFTSTSLFSPSFPTTFFSTPSLIFPSFLFLAS